MSRCFMDPEVQFSGEESCATSSTNLIIGSGDSGKNSVKEEGEVV